jgi:hypothetical protein
MGDEADIRPRGKKPGHDPQNLEGFRINPRQPLDHKDDALVPESERTDSAHFLGFLRKPQDMALPTSNRLDSKVPEAAGGLIGWTQVQVGRYVIGGDQEEIAEVCGVEGVPFEVRAIFFKTLDIPHRSG